MDRVCYDLRISTTTDNEIDILQDDGSGETVLRLSLSQVDLLIAWLAEAKRELTADHTITQPVVT